MEQSETAAGTVSAPPPAVVRQLDFTVNYKATANANARSNLILPDHPQAQLQSKLLALAQSKQVHAPARSQSPPRISSQTKLPPRKMVMPPKSPQRELPPMVAPTRSPAIAPRLAHPVNQASISKPPLLYCECFASGIYCDGCNCINCHNKMEHEDDRKGSIDAILERNPNAFRPKIAANSPHGATDGVEHNKGCNCKKSGCLKRYCECFQANILCSDKCKCVDCKNFEGSEERKAHFHQYSANSMALIQQAANAAINGAIGSPYKKSRNQQIVFGMSTNKQLPSWLPQYHQENCSTSDVSNSSLPHHPSKSEGAISGLHKPLPSYRSPLDGILQLQHVKDFCSLLVEVSAEAAQNFSKEKKTSNVTDVTEDHQNQQNVVDLCGNQDTKESDGFGVRNERPLSPATLALMCDEQHTTFMPPKAQSTVADSNPSTNIKSVSTYGLDELYVEQERLVLIRLIMLALSRVPNIIPHVRAHAPSSPASYNFVINAKITNSATTPRFISADLGMEYSDDAADIRSEFLQVLRSRRTAEEVSLSVENAQSVQDPLYQETPRPTFSQTMESCPKKEIPNFKELLQEENFYLTTEAGEQGRLPVLLLKLKADNSQKKRPAIVFLHSTHKCKEWLRPLLEAYASRDYIAVAIDSRYHGERARNLTTYRDALVSSWKNGDTMPFIFDTVLLRFLKFVILMPYDSGMHAWFAAAADTRYSVVVPIIGVQGFRWAIENEKWQARVDSIKAVFEEARNDLGKTAIDKEVVEKVWDRIAPGLASRFDSPYTVPAIAPRPLLILNGKEDPRCPLDGLKLTESRTRQTYEKANSLETFKLVSQEGIGHQMTPLMVKQASDWFDHHFKPLG
ncbi:protein tesmin/tso1-like cxc 5 [Phtheirospermum japonicum]|uniref:Protein tesmin/tso1-like cxc 5 n=1 Tax=Phtheirospermum japonicum TaxID=374723 RepID=A0A830D4A7_9LAMI|nr:protein tesmin/tso1-like cxc 5 [Phtheirospermum japonicum]